MIKIENKELLGVIFDMDGLMFDTESVYTLTWPIAAKDFGYDVTEDVVVGAIGLNAEDGCAHFKAVYGQDFPFYEIRVHRLDIAMNYIIEHGLQVKKGLYGLLDYLKSKNIKIAVATSSERARADAYLKIDRHFRLCRLRRRSQTRKTESRYFSDRRIKTRRSRRKLYNSGRFRKRYKSGSRIGCVSDNGA